MQHTSGVTCNIPYTQERNMHGVCSYPDMLPVATCDVTRMFPQLIIQLTIAPSVAHAALFGGGIINMISSAVSKGLVADDAVLVPRKAQLYCQGLERIARHPAGSHLEASDQKQQHEGPLSSADPHLDGMGKTGSQILQQIDIAVLNKYRYI
jgi:hypothetical protein